MREQVKIEQYHYTPVKEVVFHDNAAWTMTPVTLVRHPVLEAPGSPHDGDVYFPADFLQLVDKVVSFNRDSILDFYFPDKKTCQVSGSGFSVSIQMVGDPTIPSIDFILESLTDLSVRDMRLPITPFEVAVKQKEKNVKIDFTTDEIKCGDTVIQCPMDPAYRGHPPVYLGINSAIRPLVKLAKQKKVRHILLSRSESGLCKLTVGDCAIYVNDLDMV